MENNKDLSIEFVIKVPETFNEHDEDALNRDISNLLKEKGYEIINCRAYTELSDRQKPLSEDIFVFDDELCVDDSTHTKIDGYLCSTFTLVKRLLNAAKDLHTEAELSSIDNINFYAVNDLQTDEIHIDSTYYYLDKNGEEIQGSIALSITAPEQTQLRKQMEVYCHDKYNMSTISLINEDRRYAGLSPLDIPNTYAPTSLSMNKEIKNLIQSIDTTMDDLLSHDRRSIVHIYDNSANGIYDFKRDMQFWSNSYNEFHNPDGKLIDVSQLPKDLKRPALEFFSNDADSPCQLVETPAGYGIAVRCSYDTATAEAYYLDPETLFRGVIRDANLLAYASDLKNAIYIAAKESSYLNPISLEHELFVVLPADTDSKALEKAMARIGDIAYTGAEQLSNSKHRKEENSITNLLKNAESRLRDPIHEESTTHNERQI